MKITLEKKLVYTLWGIGNLTGFGLAMYGVANNNFYEVAGGIATAFASTIGGVVVGALNKSDDNNHYNK